MVRAGITMTKMTPDLHVHLASHPPELYDHG